MWELAPVAGGRMKHRSTGDECKSLSGREFRSEELIKDISAT